MRKVEIQHINKKHKLYPIIDELSFKAKNLYNAGLYEIRRSYFDGEVLKWNKIDGNFVKENQVDYRNLPSRAAQSVLRKLGQNMNSYWGLYNKWANDKSLPRPGLPRYLHKTKGRHLLEFSGTIISKLSKPNTVMIGPRTLKLELNTRVPLEKIKFVRIVPFHGIYKVEVGYEVEVEKVDFNGRIAAIDLGVNNLATVVSNTNSQPVIISGKKIKSINQHVNKFTSKFKSELPKGKFTSEKISQLWLKRDNKITNEFHSITKLLVNQFVEQDITKVIVGQNKGWKNKVKLGKKNNQNFVQIPFNRFIKQLKYKCREQGIKVVVKEESYTSKCSFFDYEVPKKQKNYIGKRVKRGLFKTSKFHVNADVNAAYNILAKHYKKFGKENRENLKRSPLKISI